MKITGRFFCGILAGVVAAGFTSCKSDDDVTPEGPAGALTDVVAPVVTPGAVDPTVTGVLDATEAGNYIENTAKQLDNICKPQDQKQSIDALVAIADALDSYDFEDDEYEFAETFAKGARKMARALKNGNYAAAPRAAQDVVYDLNVNPYEYLGVYTPVYDADEEEYIWTRTADSPNAIIFKSERDAVEVVLTVSSNSWTGKLTTVDYGYGYNPSTGTYEEYDELTNWEIKVPAKATLNMGYRGESAASAVVESNYSETAHTLSVKASAKLANIVANVQASGTDTKVTEISDATVDGTRIMYTTAEVLGNGLCDGKKLNALFMQDWEQIAAQVDNIFTSATADANLLDRIQLNAKCESLKDFVLAGNYDDEVKSEADAFAKALNDNVKTSLQFGNTSYEQGSLIWGVVPVNEGWGYTYYEVNPLVQLAGGGSPMSLEEFFESDTLSGAIDAIQRILEAYGKLFD